MTQLNHIIPFGIDPSRAELAIVSITEKTTFFKVRNDQGGHKRFLDRVMDLAHETAKTPVFAVEGNSPYAIAFEFQAYRRGYQVYEITPYKLHEMRDVLCGEDQDDYRDAKTAALIIIHLPQLLRPAVCDLRWFALKRVVKMRLRLIREQVRDINLLHHLLVQLWGPVYKGFFNKLNSPQALKFFSVFPGPGCLDFDVVKVLERLQGSELAYYRTVWGERRVRRILGLMRDSVWCGDEYLNELSLEVREVALAALARWWLCARLRSRMMGLATDWYPEMIDLVRTIPGFDWVSACSLLASVGDVRRFARISNFIAYCGLVLCKKESATIRGRRRRHRRNKLLSYLFYQVALDALASSELSRQYYAKKLAEGKKKRTALRALAKKLAEITYAVLKNKEPYDEKKHLN